MRPHGGPGGRPRQAPALTGVARVRGLVCGARELGPPHLSCPPPTTTRACHACSFMTKLFLSEWLSEYKLCPFPCLLRTGRAVLQLASPGRDVPGSAPTPRALPVPWSQLLALPPALEPALSCQTSTGSFLIPGNHLLIIGPGVSSHPPPQTIAGAAVGGCTQPAHDLHPPLE